MAELDEAVEAIRRTHPRLWRFTLAIVTWRQDRAIRRHARRYRRSS